MPDFDYSALRFWFGVLQFAGTVAVGIYAWWVTRAKNTTKAIADVREDCQADLTHLDTKITANERRIDRLENNVDNMPSHNDMDGVKSELSGLRADVREMGGTMRGLNKAVDLMTEHLMNRGSS
jgi:uncharacterized protein YPO0396